MRIITRLSLLATAILLSVLVFIRLPSQTVHGKTDDSVIKWQENAMNTARRGPCAKGISELIESFDIPKINTAVIHSILNDQNSLVQIVNGTIFYQTGDPEEQIYERHRRESFLESLHDSLPYLPRKDFELVLSVKDCCANKGPVFSVTRCKGTDQLPIVQWNKIRDGPMSKWNHRMRKSRERVKRTTWESRKGTAVFRGSVAKKWSFDEDGKEQLTRITTDNWRRVGRTILAHLANETASQEYLDVELRYAREKIPNYPFQEATMEISMEQQASRFKYTVIVEGNCGWADRLKSFLAMGTLCLVQEAPCKEYYTLLAQANHHYIPISGTLSNLTTAIEWSRRNDQRAKEIAMNGIKFADKYLTESSMKCYMRELFRAYQQRYEGVVKLDKTLPVYNGGSPGK